MSIWGINTMGKKVPVHKGPKNFPSTIGAQVGCSSLSTIGVVEGVARGGGRRSTGVRIKV